MTILNIYETEGGLSKIKKIKKIKTIDYTINILAHAYIILLSYVYTFCHMFILDIDVIRTHMSEYIIYIYLIVNVCDSHACLISSLINRAILHLLLTLKL